MGQRSVSMIYMGIAYSNCLILSKKLGSKLHMLLSAKNKEWMSVPKFVGTTLANLRVATLSVSRKPLIAYIKAA